MSRFLVGRKQLLKTPQTTAHTLAYAFILLALHPDEQEAFYQNIKSVLPSDRNPVRLAGVLLCGSSLIYDCRRHTRTSAPSPTPWRACVTSHRCPLLTRPSSVLNETLRWFPPVVHIPKKSAEDTVFNVTNPSGEKATIAVPRDSLITICVPSLHHNRQSAPLFPCLSQVR